MKLSKTTLVVQSIGPSARDRSSLMLTNRLENNLTEGGGNLDIDYSISLKGLMEGHNQLSITLM